MPFVVSNICAPDGLPHNILLLGKRGDLLLADTDLKSRIHHISKVPAEDSAPQKHFLLSRSECTFLSTRASSSSVVIAHLRRTDSLRLALFSVANESGIEELADVQIPLENKVRQSLLVLQANIYLLLSTMQDVVVDASLSSSGFLSILSASCRLLFIGLH